jgi:light-regulated signal transduction histidine kinase (bacteriophytochrome)
VPDGIYLQLKKTGTEIPIEIGLNPISLPEGKVVLTSIIDITERKKNEEIKKLQMQKIAHKNKELEQFTYIVSHDLRAPLQTISSFNQLIIDDQSEYMDETGRQNLSLY